MLTQNLLGTHCCLAIKPPIAFAFCICFFALYLFCNYFCFLTLLSITKIRTINAHCQKVRIRVSRSAVNSNGPLSWENQNATTPSNHHSSFTLWQTHPKLLSLNVLRKNAVELDLLNKLNKKKQKQTLLMQASKAAWHTHIPVYKHFCTILLINCAVSTIICHVNSLD